MRVQRKVRAMIETLAAMYQRFERVVRYAVVGTGITAVYTGVTAGLIASGAVTSPTMASVIGSLLTLPLSFLVHRRVTYADVEPGGSQFGRFSVLAAANFSLNAGLMTAVHAIGWSYWIALATGWVVVPVVNYGINGLWVFRTKTFLSLEPSCVTKRGGAGKALGA
jgi:putative flippase GtrA